MKKCYIVAFQTALPATRVRLVELLKSFGTFCPMTRNCWAIVTQQNAKEVRDFLATALGPRDRLFVVRSGTEAAWRNAFGPKNNEWLKKHL